MDYRPTVVKINLENFRHNVRVLRQASGEGNFFCPMIKANGYGHGDVELARVLEAEGVSCVGVALMEEGIRLREAGINRLDILVLYPIREAKDFQKMIKYRLTPVLSSWEGVRALEKISFEGSIPVHLKFDTGMSRLGFAPSEARRVRDFLDGQTKVRVAGVCSHLLAGEDIGSTSSRTREQIRRFAPVAKTFEGPGVRIHLWNSSGLLGAYALELMQKENWGARPGIALYGAKPKMSFSNRSARKRYEDLELKPVMSVHSEIVQIHNLRKGETVSYGGTYRARRASVIGVVPMGYADGYMRHLSSKGEMLCGGSKARVAGIVCMDYTMLDLTGVMPPKKGWLGEPVVVLGEQAAKRVHVEDLARRAKTNTYEVFTNMSGRVPRVFV